MRKRIAVILAVLALILLVASPAIADAMYHAQVRIVNSGATTVTDTAANFTLNSAYFVSNGYALADFSDVSMQSGGNELAFMPGYSTNPWMVFAPTVGPGQYMDYDLYSQGASGGKLSYFPGDAGMEIADDPSMELGNEFQWLITDCYIDTTAGAGKYIILKASSCILFVSSTTTGTISFSIPGGALVSAMSIPSGEYDIEVTANVTHLMLYIDSVLKDTEAMTANSTDNGNDWTFFSGGSTLYVGNLELIK